MPTIILKEKVLLCSCKTEILLDEDDYNNLSPCYWSCASGVVRNTTNRTAITEHILPPRDGFLIDHINRDKHDNRKINLRYATRGLNAHNAKLRTDNTSGYKGVYLVAGRVKTTFRAIVVHNQTRIHLGYFPTARAAAFAYNQKVLELYGNTAALNSL